MVCTVCPSKVEGEKYCLEMGSDFSHGICPACSRLPVVEGDVFPKPVPPFRSAGFLLRHKIETSEDMEKFLNGEL